MRATGENMEMDENGLVPWFEEESPSFYIVEQPDPSYRFRYGSEGEVVAPLHGVNSNQRVKTFPKIKLTNYDKQRFVKADIIVSCVTHNEEEFPKVHPHMVKNNKRKKGANCTNGVCHVKEVEDDGTVEFCDIGIQRVKTQETMSSLMDRKNMGIDPFCQGFTHSQYDKEAVKLCFQVFLTDARGCIVSIPPVVSNTISHAKGKVMSIHSVTPNQAFTLDPRKLTILADNLPRAGDLWVMFSTAEWSIKVRPEYQHNNSAVQVCTPKLYVELAEPTRVEIRLVRISNQAETEAVEFIFWPNKKLRCGPRTNTRLLEAFLNNEGICLRENEDTELTINDPSTNKTVLADFGVKYSDRSIQITNKYT